MTFVSLAHAKTKTLVDGVETGVSPRKPVDDMNNVIHEGRFVTFSLEMCSQNTSPRCLSIAPSFHGGCGCDVMFLHLKLIRRSVI